MTLLKVETHNTFGWYFTVRGKVKGILDAQDKSDQGTKHARADKGLKVAAPMETGEMDLAGNRS